MIELSKPKFKLRKEDFRPYHGALNYWNRNQERSTSFGVELRGYFLTGYNAFLIGAPIGFAILGAIKGIEALVK
ncbi:MAG: hypothetical protein Q7S06_01820 [Nanoarchaeota archaeon]|nr:hypothetical protein [Nanoarchaeota archaeon]